MTEILTDKQVELIARTHGRPTEQLALSHEALRARCEQAERALESTTRFLVEAQRERDAALAQLAEAMARVLDGLEGK